nr:hypothetical protein [Pandoravirus aubagnensis]
MGGFARRIVLSCCRGPDFFVGLCWWSVLDRKNLVAAAKSTARTCILPGPECTRAGRLHFFCCLPLRARIKHWAVQVATETPSLRPKGHRVEMDRVPKFYSSA